LKGVLSKKLSDLNTDNIKAEVEALIDTKSEQIDLMCDNSVYTVAQVRHELYGRLRKKFSNFDYSNKVKAEAILKTPKQASIILKSADETTLHSDSVTPAGGCDHSEGSLLIPSNLQISATPTIMPRINPPNSIKSVQSVNTAPLPNVIPKSPEPYSNESNRPLAPISPMIGMKRPTKRKGVSSSVKIVTPEIKVYCYNAAYTSEVLPAMSALKAIFTQWLSGKNTSKECKKKQGAIGWQEHLIVALYDLQYSCTISIGGNYLKIPMSLIAQFLLRLDIKEKSLESIAATFNLTICSLISFGAVGLKENEKKVRKNKLGPFMTKNVGMNLELLFQNNP
jgi:hypothetical protein